jgi:endoribonuclease Nob1
LQNSGFKEFVLDASAFYIGIPFLSDSICYTTNLVFEEVKHIKASYSALEALTYVGKLRVLEADESSLRKIIAIAKKTGDLSKLSHADISILALALQLHTPTLISDDYAIGNIATLLHIPIKSVGNKGIVRVGKWVTFCRGCGKVYKSNIIICAYCGNKLGRKFKRYI